MKTIRENPPNYEEIIQAFPSVKDRKTIVFTYGEACYAPGLPPGRELPDHLVVHEETHTKQQGSDPRAWWDKYLVDPAFRLEQELEAYGSQYAFVKSQGLRTWMEEKMLEAFASDLSSAMYGNLLTLPQAESKIRNAARDILKAIPANN